MSLHDDTNLSLDQRARVTTVRRTLYGTLFGACFPVLAMLLDMLAQGLPLTLSSVFTVQATQPLHWIINTAPLFLGLFAYFIGRNQSEVIRLPRIRSSELA